MNPFERTWEITSDAMAAWYAWLINCSELIILTNVDGIFMNGNLNDKNSLIQEITADKLSDYGHTAVDKCTSPFLKEKKINAWILNAFFPERLREAIYDKKTMGTRVLGE